MVFSSITVVKSSNFFVYYQIYMRHTTKLEVVLKLMNVILKVQHFGDLNVLGSTLKVKIPISVFTVRFTIHLKSKHWLY